MTAPQRTPEWFAARRGRVTGSVVGAILGLDPYKTRDDVMRAMVRDWHGAEPEFTGNVATDHGTFHEDGAIFDFELEFCLKVQKCGFFKYQDWLGASPDGLIGDEELIEVKCPYKNNISRTAKEQPHYYAQMQIELLCTGRKNVKFYQWASADAYTVENVPFDLEWIDEHLPKLKAFHDKFLEELKTPARHLEPKRREVQNAKARALLGEYDDLQDAIERATERKKEVLSEIVELCGDRDSLVCGRNLTRVEKEGSVSYSAVVKKYCTGVDLEPFRGEPTSYWLLK